MSDAKADGDRILAIFDAAEEYAPMIDQIMDKHKGQTIPILLMLSVNMCLITEQYAAAHHMEIPAPSDEERNLMHEFTKTVSAKGPRYTRILILCLIHWTSHELRAASAISKAENILNQASGESGDAHG